MNKPAKPQSARRDDFAQSALRALRRAAKRARVVARMHGTPVHVLRDGKIVAERG